MPHQREIVDIVHEIDPETGYLAYDEWVLIGPRQTTGKTELLLPVMTYRCVGFGSDLIDWVRANLGRDVLYQDSQRVLYTAQSADLARQKWRDIHLKRLERSDFRKDFTPRLRQNQEAFLWKNGATWSPAAPTGSASGTGDTIDLPVIDEAWAQKDSRVELGMRPATMTRLWKQFVITSMIPGLARAQPGTWRYLERKREIGRLRCEQDIRHGMAFFDFTAPDDADPADPATWWGCMPGLGYTTPERAVASDFQSMDLVDFCAEYLGWAPTSAHPRWSLIPRELWLSLRDDESWIDGPTALAIEVSDDRQDAVIGAAGRRSDGRWHWEVVEPGNKVPPGVAGIDWVERRVRDIAENKDNQITTVVIDPSRPANGFIVPLQNHGIDVTKPNARDVAAACGRWYDATGANLDVKDLPGAHIGQPELDRSVAGARKLETGNGQFVFVKKSAVSEIIWLYAVVLAQFGHELKGKPKPRSRVW